jgi:hypothetical protein
MPTSNIKVHIIRQIGGEVLMKVSMPAGAIPQVNNSVRLYLEESQDLAYLVKQVRYSFKKGKLVLVEVLV